MTKTAEQTPNRRSVGCADVLCDGPNKSPALNREPGAERLAGGSAEPLTTPRKTPLRSTWSGAGLAAMAWLLLFAPSCEIGLILAECDRLFPAAELVPCEVSLTGSAGEVDAPHARLHGRFNDFAFIAAGADKGADGATTQSPIGAGCGGFCRGLGAPEGGGGLGCSNGFHATAEYPNVGFPQVIFLFIAKNLSAGAEQAGRSALDGARASSHRPKVSHEAGK